MKDDKQRMRAVRSLIRSPFDGHDLTAKELEATKMVAFGLTQQEVAEQLGISRQAVAQRLERACIKLGVSKSSHLTAYFIKLLRATAGL